MRGGGFADRFVDGCVWEGGAVGELLHDVARVERCVVCVGEVGAAGDGHCAEPFSVGFGAVVAVDCEGPFGFVVGCVALDLGEGVGEVFVERAGVVVVERAEVVELVFVFVVVGFGVGGD